MGGGKGKAPPPPDYAAISAANKEAAEVAAGVQREQLAWAKEQYAMDRADNKAINDVFINQMNLQSKIAQEDRARYQTQYQPLEDKLIKEAQDYDTEARKQAEAGRQVANVDQMFEASRNAAEAQAASYGIDPGQMRAGALDLGSRLQEATAKAGAAYQGRTQVENTGRALRSEAINVGKGYPGQYSQASALTGQMGQNAVNTNLATTASGAATMGTGAQWAGVQNQALGNWGNYAANIYGSQMQYNAAMAGNSPWNAIGKLAGTALGGWASGGFKMAEGGGIPDDMSPSHGAIPDDVPTMTTPGEYVVPNWLVAKTGGPEAWDDFVRSHGGDPVVPPRRRMPARRPMMRAGGGFIGGLDEGFDAGMKTGRMFRRWGDVRDPNSTQAAKQVPQVDSFESDRVQKFVDGGAVDHTRPNMAYPQGEPQFQIRPGEDFGSYLARMRHYDQAEMADENQLHQEFWNNRFDMMQGRGAPDSQQMDDLYQDWQRGGVERPGMSPVMRAQGGAIPDAPDGSYNIPFDVAHRMGTEKLDKLVEKTRNPQAGKGRKQPQQPQQPADPQQMQDLMGMMIPPRGGPAQPIAYRREGGAIPGRPFRRAEGGAVPYPDIMDERVEQQMASPEYTAARRGVSTRETVPQSRNVYDAGEFGRISSEQMMGFYQDQFRNARQALEQAVAMKAHPAVIAQLKDKAYSLGEILVRDFHGYNIGGQRTTLDPAQQPPYVGTRGDWVARQHDWLDQAGRDTAWPTRPPIGRGIPYEYPEEPR